jgi:hypothetical protein
MPQVPVPAEAIPIWLEGESICLGLPGHNLKIPLARCSIERTGWGTIMSRQTGWAGLLRVLMDRALAKQPPTIGQRGDPVQYDLDRMLVAMGGKITRIEKARPADANLSLADLGL